jgi:hypothetical protein
VPFLRLTRDRRGFENTYLMHADRPGDRPRILYWYRTAPGIALGRAALDEDAIRTIEDQHPGIEFDWPAILALSEVMTPEDEAPPQRAPQQQRRDKKRGQRRDDRSRDSRGGATEAAAPDEASESEREVSDAAETGTEAAESAEPAEPFEPRNRLLEELAGREVGARLRARHAEIVSRIENLDVDGAEKDALFKRAEALDPELWMMPETVLEGVRNADALFEQLKADLGHSSRE